MVSQLTCHSTSLCISIYHRLTTDNHNRNRPSFSSSLYSISLERQLAGGNAVYCIMMLIVAFGIQFTMMLRKACYPA